MGLIRSRTIIVNAVHSAATGKFIGVEIETPMATFFVADDQARWRGVRMGQFPNAGIGTQHRGKRGDGWRRETLIDAD